MIRSIMGEITQLRLAYNQIFLKVIERENSFKAETFFLSFLNRASIMSSHAIGQKFYLFSLTFPTLLEFAWGEIK